MSTVYVLRAKGTNLVKIGFTAGEVEDRRRALQWLARAAAEIRKKARG